MEYCYIAVLTPFEDGTGYMVEVPSVPGCVTSGKDFYDAVDMIEDALAGCLCVLEDHGVPIPPETTNLDAYFSPCKERLVFIEVDTDEYRREKGEKPARVPFDRKTEKWFDDHPDCVATCRRCEACGLFYKTSLGHKCEKES